MIGRAWPRQTLTPDLIHRIVPRPPWVSYDISHQCLQASEKDYKLHTITNRKP